MKITDVKTVLLTGPSTLDPFLRKARKLRSAAFIEIHTDAGLTGLGETYAGYFCPEMVPPIVDFYKPILLGQGVDDITTLWNRMYHCGNFWGRVGLGAAVLNGVEAALWDLKGKAIGVPVYELLADASTKACRVTRRAVPATTPRTGWQPRSTTIDLSDFVPQGGHGKLFRGDRLCHALIALSHRRVRSGQAGVHSFACRQRDTGHAGWPHGQQSGPDLGSANRAGRAEGLEPYDLIFFEEPLHYTDPWGYAELCRSTSVPVAGGECLTASYEWRVFVEHDCFDIGQPDASFTGGLGEFMQVAGMLEARNRRIATHAWGAGGSLMQNVHCGFACANTLILEVAPDYGPLHSEIIDGSFVMKEGQVLPPQRPGLGISLTEATKSRYPFVPGSGEFNSVPGKVLHG